MALAGIILKQTLTMALYMLTGFLLFRGKKITIEGSKSLAAILLWLVIPCVIINSFCVAPSEEKVYQMFVSTALGAVALTVAILISKIIYKKVAGGQFLCCIFQCGIYGDSSGSCLFWR